MNSLHSLRLYSLKNIFRTAHMKNTIFISLKILFFMTLLTGVCYPVLVTLVAKALFPYTSNGSFIDRNGITVGSELIGQKFIEAKYFLPRPSAIDYNPLPSGASNLGPTSDSLRKLIEIRKVEFIRRNNLPIHSTVPSEMLFASASGLDPHISPEAAILQIRRIAKARGLNSSQIERMKALVENSVQEPQFKILGERRVNVLQLNIKLDKEYGN